jgi:hypothetical protein
MSRFLSAEDTVPLERLANRNIRNAASWRIGSEITRRYPDDVVLIDSVPIEGVDYDCLRVVRLDGAGYVDFNRNSWGSASCNGPGESEGVITAFLLEWISVADRRRMVRRISECLGMPPVKPVPPTSRRVLAYRASAAFLQAHAMDRHRWSVDGAAVIVPLAIGYREELIEAFPDLRIERSVIDNEADFATDPAFCTWFFCRNDLPFVYVTTQAVARNRKGVEVDLFETYSRTKRIDDVVAQLASLMPR